MIAGLVLGKAIGITAATLTAVRLRVGPLPTGVGRGHVGGAASLAGIGFTVSLFVADLAFEDQVLRDQAKIGVLVASVIAAVVGLAILSRRPRPELEDDGVPTRLVPAVDPAFDRTRGAIDAPSSVLVFGDYECPHTRRLVDVLRELEGQAGDRVLYAWRQLPNEGAHPGTTLASERPSARGAGRVLAVPPASAPAPDRRRPRRRRPARHRA